MQKPPPEFAALIGSDWADKKHDICLHIPGSDEFDRPLSRTVWRPLTIGPDRSVAFKVAVH